MASALQLVVESILMNNYVSVVVISGVGYDYLLTFPDEMEYIWNKPWTRVSTLFVLIRYFGLWNIISYSLLGSTFVPGPAQMCVNWRLVLKNLSLTYPTRWRLLEVVSNIIGKLGNWASAIFICAAELAMILRVWALYNQSRVILFILLVPWAIEVVTSFIGCIVSIEEEIFTTAQVIDLSLCASVTQAGFFVPNLLLYSGQIMLGGLMCLLFAFKFIKESLQLYKATKQFGLNQYMNLLAGEGVIYFIVILCYAIISILYNLGAVSMYGWWIFLLGVINGLAPYTLVARFILNLRRTYARNLQARRGSEIDTGFGLSLAPGHGAIRSAILFAGAGQPDALEQNQDEEIEHVTVERESSGDPTNSPSTR